MTNVPAKPSPFKSANDAHAIVETVIFCEFSPPLSPDLMEHLQSLKETLKDDLPVFRPLIHVSFTFDGATNQQTSKTNERGFEMTSNPRDGVIDWVVRIDENAVSIHCLNYIRWIGFWEKTEKILTNILSLLKGGESFLTNLGLRVIDRFIYDGDEKSYDATQLFKHDGLLLPQHVLTSGPLWHAHLGWYDSPKEGQKVLSQLNIDSIYANINNEPKVTATIEHNCIYRINVGNLNPTNLLTPAKGQDETLLSKMALNLHIINKVLLSNLLTDQTQKQINLDVPND